MTERGTRRIVSWSLAAAAVIILVAIFGAPLIVDGLASLIPRSLEANIGDVVDDHVQTLFNARVCDGSEGHKALVKLIEALRGEVPDAPPMQAGVVASRAKNAVALPGGRIYLFDGLLRVAENPDEIAGVLAHEIGHVVHRDAMRQLIQMSGASFLIGLLFGDVKRSGPVILASRQFLNASFSRDAEARADGVAIDVMHGLGRSPKPVGELLTRVTGDEKNNRLSILASHPLTEDRMDRFAREDRRNVGPQILNFGEWRALKNICRDAAE